MKNLLIAAFAVTLAFSACKDDKDDATPSTPGQTGSTALTGKDWRMTESVIVISGTGTTADGTYDLYADKKDCDKDNLSVFNTDKTLVEKAGATKCSPSDADSEPQGTWELLSNNTKLKITPATSGSGPETYDIVTLTESKLSISATETEDGQTTSVKFTYVKN